MSMETANQLLAEIQKVKASRATAGKSQAARPTRPPASIEQLPQQSPVQAPAPYPPALGQDVRPSMENLRTSMDNMRLPPGEHGPPPDHQYGRVAPGTSMQERYQQMQMEQQQYQQMQQQPPQQQGPPAYQYPPSETPGPVSRIPPGARVPVPPMPFNESQVQPVPQARPSSQYDRYQQPPAGPESYPPQAGYVQVSVNDIF